MLRLSSSLVLVFIVLIFSLAQQSRKNFHISCVVRHAVARLLVGYCCQLTCKASHNTVLHTHHTASQRLCKHIHCLQAGYYSLLHLQYQSIGLAAYFICISSKNFAVPTS